MVDVIQPDWIRELLACELPEEGKDTTTPAGNFVTRNGILRAKNAISATQAQTETVFGFKWKKRDTFESDVSLERMKQWLVARYGDVTHASWWDDYSDKPVVLDAGCGAGMSGIELFGELIPNLKYVCADISEAIDVAATRMAERGLCAGFIQSDLMSLPIKPKSVDVIFSEGVLHHTDSTRNAILELSKLLKAGGRFLFYVYKKKGPIREFTDDFIRDKLQALSGDEAWEKMMPLTRLGKILGELDLEIDIPEPIDLLEIPKGRISLQRFFYWHIVKCFYHENLTLDEMNHINFDWFAPMNAHRQTPEEVRAWCREAGLQIENEVVEEAGITIRAVKTS